jgi:hypothetical protein
MCLLVKPCSVVHISSVITQVVHKRYNTACSNTTRALKTFTSSAHDPPSLPPPPHPMLHEATKPARRSSVGQPPREDVVPNAIHSRDLYRISPQSSSKSKSYSGARMKKRGLTLAITARLHFVFSSCPTTYRSAIAYPTVPIVTAQKILGRTPMGLA